jgi:stage V sporulation protein K
MARHPDSPALIRYLQNTISKFIDPIEEVAWAHHEEGDDIPDAQQMFRSYFTHMFVYFASLDEISDEEAALIADVREYLNDYTDAYKGRSIREIRDLYREHSTTNEIYSELKIPAPVMYLQIYDDAYGTEYAAEAKSVFFRTANCIIKADGQVSPKEQTALSKYKDLLFNFRLERDSQEQRGNQSISEEFSSSKNTDVETKHLDELITELNSLIGLDRVKNDVAQLVNFLKVQQMRKAKGMPVQPLSRHLVFFGNPGTGKTTVARLVSQIFKSLEILSKGQLVETDRAGLVAGYVGQTALKVREVINHAIGGVLFIDEAYTLSTGSDNDFGREAIDTLLKMMEDHRDDFIVVVAGYTDKMNTFLQTNPGLRSRFNKYLEFEDYNPEQLVQIFELFCTNGGYKLSSSTHEDLIRLFSALYETRDETFGNGRLARNLYEMTINNQANRIVSLPHVNDEILSTIEKTDIPGMADMQNVR